jgi:ATP-dependent helicase HrpB
VLSAAPGSGKTTLVPLLLRDEGWLKGRRILLLEPRRPAARMAARRMSALIGQSVGEDVGYQVRFERKLSSTTRIEVLTEGLLVRRLQSDPELDGIGLVIFDEFHERHVQTDLSLALCLDVVKALRDDLRLLVMSATLDAETLCDLLQGEAVTAPGREHPVSCHYDVRDGDARESVAACLGLAAKALEETSGDVLVFLPGRREIEQFIQSARERFVALDLTVLPLHGGLDAKAQDAVLQGRDDARRRLIAATDLAETSLTIEGLTAVVDAGLARRPRFDPRSGMTRLETRRISQASATQRAGRAGRLGPGQAYRAWTPERHARLETQSRPEILDADLSPVQLEIAAWGATPQALDWVDTPTDAAWSAATGLLVALGAVNANGTITEQGKAMAGLPIHPRLAHLLVGSTAPTDVALAIDFGRAIVRARSAETWQPTTARCGSARSIGAAARAACRTART